jgi:predicted SAM-dependent methyltransferase
MTALKLNLGSGSRPMPGYVNVDKYGTPDVTHDLEAFPWPWPDNSVGEVMLRHVLEHLGQQTDVYFGIVKELHRVCQADAHIFIVVPHFRHDYFYQDPTHVRAITPEGLLHFSQRANREYIAKGMANSPLALYLNVNFELIQTKLKPSEHWFRLHPGPAVDMDLLLKESALYNNLIEEYQMVLQVIK